ncbi:MAG: hypothetical protein BWY66_00678 [bacterium ADurb.Bin374]|nr:MAG: hypothetical protein BWY66_00678 [bacterium ADurb.Bin374]
MDEDQVTSPTPPEAGRKRKLNKRERELEREMMKSRMTPEDLAAAHRKFIMIMFGLFALVLILMLAFNQHVEFMPDGGM